MITDYAKEYIEKNGFQDLVDLSAIKNSVESGEMLSTFTSWREKKYKTIIGKSGKGDPNDPKILKNPEIYGYKYRSRKNRDEL